MFTVASETARTVVISTIMSDRKYSTLLTKRKISNKHRLLMIMLKQSQPSCAVSLTTDKQCYLQTAIADDTHAYTHPHAHTHARNRFRALWTLSGDNPGEPVPEGTFYHLLNFLVQNADNTGRHTNNPDGLPPHPD